MHHTADAKGKYKRYPIAHYYLKDLANIYQTSKFLLRNRLKPHSGQICEPEEGFKYSPRQVELIFNLVPLPSGVYYYKRYKKRNNSGLFKFHIGLCETPITANSL